MKYGLLVVSLFLAGCELRITSRNFDNEDAIKSDAEYSVDASGSNIRISEFLSPSSGARCVIAEGGQGIGLSCFPVQCDEMKPDAD